MILTEPKPLDASRTSSDQNESAGSTSEALMAPIDFALERPDLEKKAKKLVPAEEHHYAPFVVRRYETESSNKPAVTCLDWSDGPTLNIEKLQSDIKDARSNTLWRPLMWSSAIAMPAQAIYLGAEQGMDQHITAQYAAIGAVFAVAGLRSVVKNKKQTRHLQHLLDSSPSRSSELEKASLPASEQKKLAKLKEGYTQIDKDSLGRAIRGEAMAFSDKTVEYKAIVLDSPLQVFGTDVPPYVALELLTHLSIGFSGSQSSEANDNQFDVSVRTGDVVCGSLDLVKDPSAFIADNFDRLWDISISEGAIGNISRNQRFTRSQAGDSNDGQLEDLQQLHVTVTQSHLYDVMQVGCNVYEDICMQVQSLLDDYVVLNPDTAVAKAWVDSKDEHLPNRIAAIGPSFLNEAVPDYMQYEGYPLPNFLRRIARVFGRSGGTLEAERLQEGTSSGVRF